MKTLKTLTMISACLLLGACQTTGTTPKQCSEKSAKQCTSSAHTCPCEKLKSCKER